MVEPALSINSCIIFRFFPTFMVECSDRLVSKPILEYLAAGIIGVHYPYANSRLSGIPTLFPRLTIIRKDRC